MWLRALRLSHWRNQEVRLYVDAPTVPVSGIHISGPETDEMAEQEYISSVCSFDVKNARAMSAVEYSPAASVVAQQNENLAPSLSG